MWEWARRFAGGGGQGALRGAGGPWGVEDGEWPAVGVSALSVKVCRSAAVVCGA